MKKNIPFLAVLFFVHTISVAQTGWKKCNGPVFGNRVDDIFMVNTQIGYAVCGDGKIVKTTDGGNNWTTLLQNNNIYCRSVEFINTQKGFVGGFPAVTNYGSAILRRTTDGGATWEDLTPLLHPKAKKGICGLAAADENTIYGCGNWYQDSAYIIKSADGGNTWSFIDMHSYASSIIDMYFTDKNTGFATGRGPLPLQSAVILYTNDGGASWTYKFQNTTPSEYCWKIQRLTGKLYFASIEDMTNAPAKVLSSKDGGMTWAVHQVVSSAYNIEGIGFIDSLKGWTGGDNFHSFETNDGGQSWDAVSICPLMNRVFKVNDTMLFATGNNIWRYTADKLIPAVPASRYAWMHSYPNPVKGSLRIDVSLSLPTHALVMLLDNTGRRIAVIDNTDRPKGSYYYQFNTDNLPQGLYYIVLKTHEDKQVEEIIVNH